MRQSGAHLAGMGAVIEKKFQGGGDKLRALGLHLESLAIVEKIEDGIISFA